MTSEKPKHLYDLSVWFSTYDITKIAFSKILNSDASVIEQASLNLEGYANQYSCNTVINGKKSSSIENKPDTFIDLVQLVGGKLNANNINSITINDSSKKVIGNAEKNEYALEYLKNRLVSVAKRYSFTENELSYKFFGASSVLEGKFSTLSELKHQVKHYQNTPYEISFNIINGKMDSFTVAAENKAKGLLSELSSKFLAENSFNVLNVCCSDKPSSHSSNKFKAVDAYLDFAHFLSDLKPHEISSVKLVKDSQTFNINQPNEIEMRLIKNDIVSIASSYSLEPAHIKAVLNIIKPDTNIKMLEVGAIKNQAEQKHIGE